MFSLFDSIGEQKMQHLHKYITPYKQFKQQTKRLCLQYNPSNFLANRYIKQANQETIMLDKLQMKYKVIVG
jgi:hypothetical protein